MIKSQNESGWGSKQDEGCQSTPSKWDEKQLQRLSVEMVPLTVEQFFGCRVDQLPHPEFVNSQFAQILSSAAPPFDDGGPPTSLLIRNLFDLMGHASQTRNANILAARIMEYMGYQLIDSNFQPSITFEHPVNFVSSGLTSTTHLDVALVDRARTLACFYSGEKRNQFSEINETPIKWPHPYVFAHALGAYHANTAARLESAPAMGPEAEALNMVIPAFTFVGTLPCFYIIPITAALAKTVADGRGPPPHRTKVFYCIAPVEWKLYGMLIKEQRVLIFRMFEAFKKFVPQSFAELYRFSTLNVGNAAPKIPPPLNPDFKTNVWDWVHRCLWETRLHYPQPMDDWESEYEHSDVLNEDELQEPVAPLLEPPMLPHGYSTFPHSFHST